MKKFMCWLYDIRNNFFVDKIHNPFKYIIINEKEINNYLKRINKILL
jgi:hypothetical protein